MTGCDNSSKAGTKADALKANPCCVSEGFRILDPDVWVQSTAKTCWILLVSSIQKTNSYNWHEQAEIMTRPVPSHQTCHPPLLATLKKCSINISRSFYISYQMCSILDDVKVNLDPTVFGYIMEHDLLLPSNKITQLPEDMTAVCNCQQLHCANKWCSCRKPSTSCSKFCKCKDEIVEYELVECKNICTQYY